MARHLVVVVPGNLISGKLLHSGILPALPVEGPVRARETPVVGMGARVPRIWYDLAPFDRERIARVGSFQQRKRIGQRHVLDWRRLDGLGARGVQGMARVLVDEVGALHGAAADAARIAVGGKALGDPAHGVADRLVPELVRQLHLTLLPLFRFLHGQSLALHDVVAGVAGLGRLGDLGIADQGSNVVVGRAVFVTTTLVVQLWQHREAVWGLHVRVASQGRKQGGVRAVEIGVVDRAVQRAQRALLSFRRQAHF